MVVSLEWLFIYIFENLKMVSIYFFKKIVDSVYLEDFFNK